MRFHLPILIFLLSGCSAPPPPDLSRLQDLSPFLLPVRSIQPVDSDFSDLEPLKNLLKGNQLILLGEQSHGDGAAFEAKLRLIRFLHQEMGYSAVVMESGLVECELAEQAMSRGVPAKAASEKAIFDIWSGSRQFQPFFSFLDSARAIGNPVRLAGCDLQITGPLGRDSLRQVVSGYLSHQQVPDTLSRSVLSVLDSVTTGRRSPRSLTPRTAEIWTAGIRTLLTLTRQDSLEFGHQVLRSLSVWFEFLRKTDFNKPDPNVFNLRDRQMAENLLWLMNTQLKDRKIIVWAASSHISRNRNFLIGRMEADSAMIPMGHYLREVLGDRLYCLGFTAGKGKVAIRDRMFWDLAEPGSGTLESVLMASEFDFQWLDFSHLPADHWLWKPVQARPYGYTVMTGRWPGMMDGLFFIRTMTPSTGLN
ncbi:MAG: erythromycin esterase family protein [Bacteroidetes bacterium]|nr:erythromycin esterase family protein [Bacteroidota bacterium]